MFKASDAQELLEKEIDNPRVIMFVMEDDGVTASVSGRFTPIDVFALLDATKKVTKNLILNLVPDELKDVMEKVLVEDLLQIIRGAAAAAKLHDEKPDLNNFKVRCGADGKPL